MALRGCIARFLPLWGEREEGRREWRWSHLKTGLVWFFFVNYFFLRLRVFRRGFGCIGGGRFRLRLVRGLSLRFLLGVARDRRWLPWGGFRVMSCLPRTRI